MKNLQLMSGANLLSYWGAQVLSNPNFYLTLNCIYNVTQNV